MTPKPDELEPCVCGAARAHVHTFNTYVNVHCESLACPFNVMADTAGRAIVMWNAAMRALKEKP